MYTTWSRSLIAGGGVGTGYVLHSSDHRIRWHCLWSGNLGVREVSVPSRVCSHLARFNVLVNAWRTHDQLAPRGAQRDNQFSWMQEVGPMQGTADALD
jgi:hypothetical protein